jgi:hypothetical protein
LWEGQMSSVRSHIRIDAPSDTVWVALRDVPPEEYNPLVQSSGRSHDRTILRIDFVVHIDGQEMPSTAHNKIVECDDDLRRLRHDSFAATGPYNFLRPMAGGDWIFDVVEDGDGCIFISSVTDMPANRVAAVQAFFDGYTTGLKRFCESGL